MANPVTVSDRLLIGYQIPFDTVNITLKTARSGGSVTWQYWNGTSFGPLTTATDTTSGLTTTGTVTFLPPGNWTPHAVHGSQAKYWVQITVSGAGTNPKLAKVYGDNLMTGSNARGWNACAGGSGHINIGTPVEYCGSPAAGHTAKFRQQARQLGYAPMPTTISTAIPSISKTVRTLGPTYSRRVSQLTSLIAVRMA